MSDAIDAILGAESPRDLVLAEVATLLGFDLGWEAIGNDPTDVTGRRKIWKGTPPDKGTRRQISEPGTGRARAKKQAVADPPVAGPQPVETPVTAAPPAPPEPPAPVRPPLADAVKGLRREALAALGSGDMEGLTRRIFAAPEDERRALLEHIGFLDIVKEIPEILHSTNKRDHVAAAVAVWADRQEFVGGAVGEREYRQQDPGHPVAAELREDARARGVIADVLGNVPGLNPEGADFLRALEHGGVAAFIDEHYSRPPTEAAYGALERVTLVRRLALTQQRDKTNAAAKAALQETLQAKRPIKFAVKRTASFKEHANNATGRAAVQKALAWVSSVCEGRGENIEVHLQARPNEGRAYYRPSLSPLDWIQWGLGWKKSVVINLGSSVVEGGYLNGDRAGSVVAHEMGHVIEEAHPEVKGRLKEFLEYRVGDEQATRIPMLPPDEVGRKNHFGRYFDAQAAYYVGKQYPGGQTEVLSMGLEALYNDPVGFMQADPEFATLVISILQGGNGGKSLGGDPLEGWERGEVAVVRAVGGGRPGDPEEARAVLQGGRAPGGRDGDDPVVSDAAPPRGQGSRRPGGPGAADGTGQTRRDRLAEIEALLGFDLGWIDTGPENPADPNNKRRIWKGDGKGTPPDRGTRKQIRMPGTGRAPKDGHKTPGAPVPVPPPAPAAPQGSPAPASAPAKTPTPEGAKPKAKIPGVYGAVVLSPESRARLLEVLAGRIPPGWKAVAHHMTTAYGQELEPALEGKRGKLRVVAVGFDPELQVLAVKVESDIPSENAHPHVTVAVGPQGKPKDSNRISDWQTLETPLELDGTAQTVRPAKKPEAASDPVPEPAELWKVSADDYAASVGASEPKFSFFSDVSPHQLSKMSKAAIADRARKKSEQRAAERAKYDAAIEVWTKSVISDYRSGKFSLADVLSSEDFETDIHGAVSEVLRESGLELLSPFKIRLMIQDGTAAEYLSSMEQKFRQSERNESPRDLALSDIATLLGFDLGWKAIGNDDTDVTGRRKIWQGTPPDKGTRRQISEPGTGRAGAKKQPAADPPVAGPQPVETPRGRKLAEKPAQKSGGGKKPVLSESARQRLTAADGAREVAAELRETGEPYDELRADYLEQLAATWDRLDADDADDPEEGDDDADGDSTASMTQLDKQEQQSFKPKHRVRDDTPAGASLRMNSYLKARVDLAELRRRAGRTADLFDGIGTHGPKKQAVFPIEGKYYVVDIGADGSGHTQVLREVPEAEVKFHGAKPAGRRKRGGTPEARGQ